MLAFQLFGHAHCVILAITLGVPLAMGLVARFSCDEKTPHRFALALAALGICSKMFTYFYAMHIGELNWRQSLPMHLCDWAGFTAMLALILRRAIFYELSFFWGLAGTLQAILTPDLAQDFPDPRAFTFFINHGIIIAAVIFLTVGARMRP